MAPAEEDRFEPVDPDGLPGADDPASAVSRPQPDGDRAGRRRGWLGRRRGPAGMAAPVEALARDLSRRAAGRARREAVLILPLIAITLALNQNRERLFRADLPVRLTSVLVLVMLGWAFARDLGRGFRPVLFRRVSAGTAGTVEFLIRLAALSGVLLLALNIAGVTLSTLATGGALAFVLIGLAAQQTLGNLIAGIVLLSARPFRVGDRVRLQAGLLGGDVHGTVTAQGLLYTTLVYRSDRRLVPNSLVLSSVVMPLYEVGSIQVRVTLRPDVDPAEVRALFDAMATPIRTAPRMELEEVSATATIVRIKIAPASAEDSRRLTDEVFRVLSRYVGDGSVGGTSPRDRSR